MISYYKFFYIIHSPISECFFYFTNVYPHLDVALDGENLTLMFKDEYSGNTSGWWLYISKVKGLTSSIE